MSLASLITSALATLALALAPAPADAGVQSFDDWTVACDQTFACEAINVSDAFAARQAASDPPDLPGGFGLMRLEREGEPDAEAVLTVTFNVWGEPRVALPAEGLTLHVSDPGDEDRTGPGYRLQPMGFGRYQLPADLLAKFLAESRQSNMAAVRLPSGELYGLLTTRGLAATLRYIDIAQGRAGRPDALIAARERPIPWLAGGPKAVSLRTRPIFEGATIRDPDLASFRDRHCPATPAQPIAARSWRLAGGPLLIAVPCDDKLDLWVVRENGRDQVLLLPIEGGRDLEGLLDNASIDSAQGLLSAFQASRGFGDCGVNYRWGWTGRSFELAEVKVMGPCVGYMTPDWLTTYSVAIEVGS